MLLALALPASPLGCTAEDAPAVPTTSTTPAPVPRAHLRGLKGNVQIKRSIADEWSTASDGVPLFENDKVRTEAGAGADLVFSGNGSMVHLGGDSLIGIAETRPRPGRPRTDLTVLRGRIDAELERPSTQSLSVNTPAATIQAGREIVFQ
ncbi:FecR domain-containing protein [Myxococcus sp. CA051A]|uniref:FecR domain-containing protein n=1 Tax=Myxococcus llanfairpwllgwyngyllgogerychwyrndrobwllllantysiliogogogochensis TaxID=2590453 RepID=A0A540WPH7_9BACT|nr:MULTISPECIES: FecR family protein [Myxococcus]NTX08141.1 FecR domain-containing protein [Myxococcus sp. CA040A]NTX17766.1 FecR domain-containing protein [Myxococcus sp. CA056]NTX39903.1 FecR domain-containing protein [Myxococcus sp. CA033]NTX55684.1 FecR domain-containing protein [Myxococcus sp. CA039A]NTX65987.1 FecR domain-containing protein [Myxococcus sp. CA051A]